MQLKKQAIRKTTTYRQITNETGIKRQASDYNQENNFQGHSVHILGQRRQYHTRVLNFVDPVLRMKNAAQVDVSSVIRKPHHTAIEIERAQVYVQQQVASQLWKS